MGQDGAPRAKGPILPLRSESFIEPSYLKLYFNQTLITKELNFLRVSPKSIPFNFKWKQLVSMSLDILYRSHIHSNTCFCINIHLLSWFPWRSRGMLEVETRIVFHTQNFDPCHINTYTYSTYCTMLTLLCVLILLYLLYLFYSSYSTYSSLRTLL